RLDDRDTEAFGEEIIAARGADIEVGRVVQRGQLVVPDEAEKPHRVAYPERRRQPLELRPTRADARHDVPDRRNGGAHGGQRATSAVQRLFATTTAAPPSSSRAVHRLKRERLIFAWSSSCSVPCTITPYGRP